MALEDSSKGVHKAAANALGRIGDSRAVELLAVSLRRERNTDAGLDTDALRKTGGPRVVALLIAALEDENPWARMAAADALGKIGDSRAVETLAVALKEEDSTFFVRVAAANALGKIGGPGAVEPLGMALEDESTGACEAAANALAKIGGPRVVELLAAALRDGQPGRDMVRFAAVNALGKIGGSGAVEPLGMALEDNNKGVCKAAANALGKIGDPRAKDLLAAAKAPAKSGSSIYDRRDEPAYRHSPIDPRLAENPHILRWWTPVHDEILTDLIARWQWDWASKEVTDEVLKITPEEVVEKWRTQDPACRRHVWYNVILYFARSRAEQLGLTDAIKEPQWKTCLLCDERFVEDSLPGPLIRRLGMERLDFCAPCMHGTLGWDSGDKGASEESILEYLRDMADATGRVPAQGFGEGVDDLHGLDTSSRIKLLKLLQKKPAVSRVQEAFGSWLNALIQAGVLEDGTRRTSRGIQTIAQDGHVCLSLGEKTIDDWLSSHGIPHEKEPRYPVGNHRADWRVGDAFIEYFGLVGNPDYDEKTREKVRICRNQSIVLVAVYPKDLANQDKIDMKLAPLVPAKSG